MNLQLLDLLLLELLLETDVRALVIGEVLLLGARDDHAEREITKRVGPHAIDEAYAFDSFHIDNAYAPQMR